LSLNRKNFAHTQILSHRLDPNGKTALNPTLKTVNLKGKTCVYLMQNADGLHLDVRKTKISPWQLEEREKASFKRW